MDCGNMFPLRMHAGRIKTSPDLRTLQPNRNPASAVQISSEVAHCSKPRP